MQDLPYGSHSGEHDVRTFQATTDENTNSINSNNYVPIRKAPDHSKVVMNIAAPKP